MTIQIQLQSQWDIYRRLHVFYLGISAAKYITLTATVYNYFTIYYYVIHSVY